MRRLTIALVFIVLAGAVGVLAASSVRPDEGGTECVDLQLGFGARACYIDYLLDRAETPDELVEVAVELIDGDRRQAEHFLFECHEVFHEIGERFSAQGRVLDYSNVPFESCTFGIVHGANDVLLAAMSADGLADLPADWCEEGARASHGLDGYKHSCLHGIGHAAMERALETMPVASAATFVRDVCRYDDPSTDALDRAYFEFHCLDGAYMQWILDSLRVDRSLATSQPMEVCRDLAATDPPAAQACYRQIVPLLLDTATSLVEPLERCEAERTFVEEVYVRHCIRSVSANVYVFHGSADEAIEATCGSATDEVHCVAEFDRTEAYNKGPQHQPYGTLCARYLADAVDVRRCTDWASGGIELLGVDRPPGT